MSVPTKEPRNGNNVSENDESRETRRLCEECNEKVSLYQCPGCFIRTCSLHCCQAHKNRTKCSGKRSRGAYLPLCRMNDSTLRSDYFFMEEILDVMPRARKVSKLAEEGKISKETITRGNTSKSPKAIATINRKAKRLVLQAQHRGITLQIMPPVLERHKNNSSWYCSSRDLITWKVEVVLVPRKITFSFDLSEQEEMIFNRISKYIAETYRNDSGMPSSLSPYDYKLLIKRLPCSANKPKYIQIKKNECLKNVLEGLTIIEYPTIYCVLNERLHDFPIGTYGITEQPAKINPSKDSANPEDTL